MDDRQEAYDLAEITGVGLANTQAEEIWRQMMAIDTSWYRSAFSQQLRAEGRAEGIAEERTQNLLRVLNSRGVPITEEQRGLLEACTDLDQLDEWFDRALTATTAEEVFDPH